MGVESPKEWMPKLSIGCQRRTETEEKKGERNELDHL
jgi:hypothetical protein